MLRWYWWLPGKFPEGMTWRDRRRVSILFRKPTRKEMRRAREIAQKLKGL